MTPENSAPVICPECGDVMVFRHRNVNRYYIYECWDCDYVMLVSEADMAEDESEDDNATPVDAS